MTVIAGCNLDTLTGLKFDLSDEAAPRLTAHRERQGPNSGDSTVPLWSALLPGADTYYIQEKHSDLPANRQVIQAVLALIRGRRAALPAELPAPRRFPAAFAAPAPTPPEALEARIRSGTAGKDDLEQLYFAL